MKKALAVVVLTTMVLVPAMASSAISEPNVGAIAFVRRGDDGHLHIYSIQSNGSDEREVTKGNADDSEPAWSPDGGRIVFTRDTPFAPPRIWVVNADGTDPQDLMPGRSGSSPTWGDFWPGGRIAFQRHGHIWLMEADGSNQTEFPSVRGCNDYTPSFNPVRASLAFVRECKSPELPEGIFTMGDDGSQQTRVIPAFHDDTYYEDPAFSPGGIQLAFTVDEQEGSEGTGDSVVGHGSGLTVNKFPRQYAGLGCFVDYDGYGEFECDIRDPSWDPTGSQVVYTINDQNGMIGLYILGPGPEALPQFLTQGSEAAWNSPGDATAAS